MIQELKLIYLKNMIISQKYKYIQHISQTLSQWKFHRKLNNNILSMNEFKKYSIECCIKCIKKLLLTQKSMFQKKEYVEIDKRIDINQKIPVYL